VGLKDEGLANFGEPVDTFSRHSEIIAARIVALGEGDFNLPLY
jgi:hypothetical protein